MTARLHRLDSRGPESVAGFQERGTARRAVVRAGPFP